jgi:hypothetical protein
MPTRSQLNFERSQFVASNWPKTTTLRTSIKARRKRKRR